MLTWISSCSFRVHIQNKKSTQEKVNFIFKKNLVTVQVLRPVSATS